MQRWEEVVPVDDAPQAQATVNVTAVEIIDMEEKQFEPSSVAHLEHAQRQPGTVYIVRLNNGQLYASFKWGPDYYTRVKRRQALDWVPLEYYHPLTLKVYSKGEHKKNGTNGLIEPFQKFLATYLGGYGIKEDSVPSSEEKIDQSLDSAQAEKTYTLFDQAQAGSIAKIFGKDLLTAVETLDDLFGEEPLPVTPKQPGDIDFDSFTANPQPETLFVEVITPIHTVTFTGKPFGEQELDEQDKVQYEHQQLELEEDLSTPDDNSLKKSRLQLPPTVTLSEEKNHTAREALHDLITTLKQRTPAVYANNDEGIIEIKRLAEFLYEELKLTGLLEGIALGARILGYICTVAPGVVIGMKVGAAAGAAAGAGVFSVPASVTGALIGGGIGFWSNYKFNIGKKISHLHPDIAKADYAAEIMKSVSPGK